MSLSEAHFLDLVEKGFQTPQAVSPGDIVSDFRV